MSVNYTDFDKIWASTSPLTPYEFSESQYKEGWNFVGATPPSRQMWDSFMKNADEKLKYLYQHEDVPLGHEYFTFNPNVPQGSLPLFGGEYDRATYSDLWNWVQQQTGYLKTEAEWQTLATANNGNVPYYSDGDGSTTFRVPSLKCWVKGANGTVSEVGSYLAAGLPNITGYAWNFAGYDSSQHEALRYQNDLSFASPGGGTALGGGNIHFNASWSNPIYGNSTTVQPPSIVGMWLVKAYGVVEDTGSIDEQQYLDDRMADLKNVYLPANYLPLSGGTMTGPIVRDGIAVAGMPSHTRYVTICGGGDGDNGSSITLRGKGNNSGFFDIVANDGTNRKVLAGNANGSLVWGGVSLTDGTFLTTRSVSVNASSGTASYSITAPAVSGYQFICWYMSASNGNVYPTYISDSNTSSTKVWAVNPTNNTSIVCFALYVRKW